MCPSSHLQPTINYGHAFGNPVKATTEVDLGPLLEDEELVFQYFGYQSRYSREAGVQNRLAGTGQKQEMVSPYIPARRLG